MLVQRTERLPRTLARRVLDSVGYGTGRGNGGLQHRQASVPVKRIAQAKKQARAWAPRPPASSVALRGCLVVDAPEHSTTGCSPASQIGRAHV